MDTTIERHGDAMENSVLARLAPRVSWGAIFAGSLVTVGIWLLLHILGMGLGLTAIDPDDPGSLRGVGIGTGVWSLIAPIIALFVGGLVVGRLAGPLARVTGAIHGAVIWALGTVASMLLLASLIGSLLGGAAQLGRGAVAAGTQGAAGLEDVTLDTLGLRAEDLVAPINQRLQAEGKPTVTAAQLQTAAREALRTSVRQGRVDRDIMIRSLADNTALSRQDATEIAASLEQRVNARQQQLSAAGQDLQRNALQAAETTGKALIGLFFALLLGLAAAVTGATLSVRREQKRVAREASPPPVTGQPVVR